MLRNDDLAQALPGKLHVISFQSHTVKRVCRSIGQAEAYNLELCVEDADLVRAAIVDAKGLLNPSNGKRVPHPNCTTNGSPIARVSAMLYVDPY